MKTEIQKSQKVTELPFESQKVTKIPFQVYWEAH